MPQEEMTPDEFDRWKFNSARRDVREFAADFEILRPLAIDADPASEFNVAWRLAEGRLRAAVKRYVCTLQEIK